MSSSTRMCRSSLSRTIVQAQWTDGATRGRAARTGRLGVCRGRRLGRAENLPMPWVVHFACYASPTIPDWRPPMTIWQGLARQAGDCKPTSSLSRWSSVPSVSAAILDEVRDNRISAPVLATHGRTGLLRAVLGQRRSRDDRVDGGTRAVGAPPQRRFGRPHEREPRAARVMRRNAHCSHEAAGSNESACVQ